MCSYVYMLQTCVDLSLFEHTPKLEWCSVSAYMFIRTVNAYPEFTLIINDRSFQSFGQSVNDETSNTIH